MDSREALVALNLVEGVGPVRVRQLLEFFGDAPAVLKASKQQLLAVRGIGDETASAIHDWEKSVDLAAELKRIADYGCRVITQADAEYPAMLREIYDPPVILYIKGALTDHDKNSVAMVGSRQTTHYGIETARKLAYQLAYTGVTVVSGGARGIDTAAHQGALSGKGRTIAVLDSYAITTAPVWPLGNGAVWMLARQVNISAYDAGYLYLAKTRGLKLATVDGPLVNKAAKAGVALLFKT